jgi:hypothetical protein
MTGTALGWVVTVIKAIISLDLTISLVAACNLQVYQYLRDQSITMNTAISVPSNLVSSMKQCLTVFLTGRGTILHIINDLGGQSNGLRTNAQWYCGTSYLT